MKTNLSRNEKLVLTGLGVCLISFTVFMGRLSAPTIKIDGIEVDLSKQKGARHIFYSGLS